MWRLGLLVCLWSSWWGVARGCAAGKVVRLDVSRTLAAQSDAALQTLQEEGLLGCIEQFIKDRPEFNGPGLGPMIQTRYERCQGIVLDVNFVEKPGSDNSMTAKELNDIIKKSFSPDLLLDWTVFDEKTPFAPPTNLENCQERVKKGDPPPAGITICADDAAGASGATTAATTTA